MSPRGYHLYFNYDCEVGNETLHELCVVFNKPNMFRGGKNQSQYVLVPLSCVNKKYYEFINTSNLMDFIELIGETL